MSGGAGDERGPLAALAEIAPRHGRTWLVGGAVRDALLGRITPDYDLAVAGDARGLARELARRAGGHAFQLSGEFGAWRVRARGPGAGWQVDVTPLMGETLDADLRRRDLTINAIACELPATGMGRALDLDGIELIDPCGGVADLRAGRLRSAGPDAFHADPLRVLRLARIAAELGFDPEPETLRLAGASAAALASVAAERVFTELRLTVSSVRAVAGLELARELGATAVVLPELDALRGVVQSDYHHLDVHAHTLATLQGTIDLTADPRTVFGEELAPALITVMDEPLANELTRGQALRFGALMHDIAKPLTRAVGPQGRTTFFEHDVRGADLSQRILSRLRASERLGVHVAALTRNHLRLGFLVRERPLSARVRYRYLAACEPVEVDVTLLSVADRLATLGRDAERAVPAHVQLAREMLPEALAWHARRPRPPLAGDVLAAELGIDPGPRLGRLLEALTEAAYAGEIDGRERVIEYSRVWLAHEPAAER